MKTNKECASCEKRVDYNYCSHCGQKVLKKENKKLKYFFSELFSSLFFADGKAFITFKSLLLTPGEATNTIISGNSTKYLAPLKVFFFANLVYFLFPLLNTFNTNLQVQLNLQFYSEIASDLVTKHLSDNNVDYMDYQSAYETKSSNISKILLIFLVVAQACTMKVLFLRRRDLFFVDFLSASCYFTSFYILTYLILIPSVVIVIGKLVNLNIEDVLSNQSVSITVVLLINIYLFFFLKRAFNSTVFKAIISSVVLTIFLIPTVVLYRFVLFLVTHFLIIV